MNGIKFVVLWSDALFALLLLAMAAGIAFATRKPHLRRAWQGVFASPAAMASATVLMVVLGITVLDSLHFRVALPDQAGAAIQYSSEVVSVFDVTATHLHERREKSYSAPFAWQLLEKQTVRRPDGSQVREQPRLHFGAAHLADPQRDRGGDIAGRVLKGVAAAAAAWLIVAVLAGGIAARQWQVDFRVALRRLLRGETILAWDAMLWTVAGLLAVFVPLVMLSQVYHVFGTDQVGGDVFFSALKSLRTALMIGTLATLVVLPLGIGLGISAGYFGGWIDDVIQYIYTVISSIPYVLLIAAAVLLMQVAIETHTQLFDTPLARADARLVALCVIIGSISWTSLCRLMRAETLKLRELDYVQAARCFGVSSLRIMSRHILPNAFHLVLINTVIEFSYLVLAEAVLSFVGVGVDPSTVSFGTMINAARAELAREPMVWWSIVSSFIFMVSLVLTANLFADAVRDAFDPRGQSAVRRRVVRRAAA